MPRAFLDLCSRELKGQLWSWKGGNKKRMLKAQSDLRERPPISSWANKVLHLAWLSSCLLATNPPHAHCCVRLSWPQQPHLCSARGTWREAKGRRKEKNWLLPADFLLL